MVWFLIRLSLSEADRKKESSGIAAGNYTGPGQPMIIGEDGSITYDDALGITHVRVMPNETIKATFPDKELGRGHLHEVTLFFTGVDPRPTWAVKIGEDTYKAMAIPYSPKAIVLRLEIIDKEGKLVAGARQFFSVEPRFHPIFPPK